MSTENFIYIAKFDDGYYRVGYCLSYINLHNHVCGIFKDSPVLVDMVDAKQYASEMKNFLEKQQMTIEHHIIVTEKMLSLKSFQ